MFFHPASNPVRRKWCFDSRRAFVVASRRCGRSRGCASRRLHCLRWRLLSVGRPRSPLRAANLRRQREKIATENAAAGRVEREHPDFIDAGSAALDPRAEHEFAAVWRPESWTCLPSEIREPNFRGGIICGESKVDIIGAAGALVERAREWANDANGNAIQRPSGENAGVKSSWYPATITDGADVRRASLSTVDVCRRPLAVARPPFCRD